MLSTVRNQFTMRGAVSAIWMILLEYHLAVVHSELKFSFFAGVQFFEALRHANNISAADTQAMCFTVAC